MLSIVYIPGCWDLLHVGHVRILERAHMLGDKLIVGVASDAVIYEDKGRYPIVDLECRMEMLEALWCVDIAAPYHELEFITHLNLFKPDIMAVGSTWGHDTRHQGAEVWCQHNNCRFIKLPYTHGVSSTILKERINNGKPTSHEATA